MLFPAGVADAFCCLVSSRWVMFLKVLWLWLMRLCLILNFSFWKLWQALLNLSCMCSYLSVTRVASIKFFSFTDCSMKLSIADFLFSLMLWGWERNVILNDIRLLQKTLLMLSQIVSWPQKRSKKISAYNDPLQKSWERLFFCFL